MLIDVSKLKSVKNMKKDIHLVARPDADALGYPELKFTQPVNFTGTLENDGSLLLLSGRASGELQLECSRCLKSYTLSFTVDVNNAYTNQPEVAAADRDDEIHLFTGDQLDISLAVLQQIFLELPVQPLCKDNCLGLCSRCGANLNDGPCHCMDNDIDPRLEKLKLLWQDDRKGVE